MSLPTSLRALREQRAAFLQALEASPAMSAFAALLHDLTDGRPRQLKNEELIRAAAGALPLTQPLTHLTVIVTRRLELAGIGRDRKTVQRVLKKMQSEISGNRVRDSRMRRIAPDTLRSSELAERR